MRIGSYLVTSDVPVGYCDLLYWEVDAGCLTVTYLLALSGIFTSVKVPNLENAFVRSVSLHWYRNRISQIGQNRFHLGMTT